MGAKPERATYQAYGARESDYRPTRFGEFREDYGFTGKEEDVEVGLTYFGKRFYAPALQRWISADPLEVHRAGSAEGNIYCYATGQVLRNVDPNGLDIDDVITRSTVRDAVRSLGRRGLDLGFANAVTKEPGQGRYGTYIHEVGSDHYSPVLNEIGVTRRTRDELRSKGSSVGYSVLYEELAHAYLGKLEQQSNEFASKVKQWSGYYEGAPTASGGKTTDPYRLVHEAMGGYVGSAVANWQLAYESLSALEQRLADLDPSKLSNERLQAFQKYYQGIVTDYRKQRSASVHGYSVEGGVLGFFGEQDATTRAMPKDMRDWLDEHVLEGKVGAEVHSDATLGAKAARIEEAFRNIESQRGGE